MCLRPVFLEARVTRAGWGEVGLGGESLDEEATGGAASRDTDKRAKSIVTASEDGCRSPSVAVVGA